MELASKYNPADVEGYSCKTCPHDGKECVLGTGYRPCIHRY